MTHFDKKKYFYFKRVHITSCSNTRIITNQTKPKKLNKIKIQLKLNYV